MPPPFFILLVVTSIILFGQYSFADNLAEREGQPQTCQELLSNGLRSGDLRLYAKQIAQQQNSSANLIDQSGPLDHRALGPEGQEVFDNLNRLMVGHQEVKLALARAVQRGATGTKNANRPVATILLLGITGTGKTLTAEALAQAITGDPNLFVTISGGEMQEDHEISKVTSSPAGYMGHNATPPLVTQEILDRNTSKRYRVNVVLVDELEKGSIRLQHLLLGIMDKGRMTTGTNEVVNFSKTILILTSNLGQAEMNAIINDNGSTIGFTAFQNKPQQEDPGKRRRRIEQAALNAIRKSLSPEFRNRIDNTFIFEELSPEESQRVLNMNLAAVQRRSFFSNPETRIVFSVTPEAREFILAHGGYEPGFGGRNIRRAIEHLLVEPLTNLIGSKQIKSGDLVEVSAPPNGQGLAFSKIAEGLSTEQQAMLYSKIYGNDVPDASAEKIAKNDPQKYTPGKYSEFLAHLESLSDYRDKLDMIDDFVTDSPFFGDTEFLDLYERLPDEMNWGRRDSDDTTAAMERAGYGNWENMDFQPIRLLVIWQGMQRIKSLSPKNRQRMNDIAGPIEESVRAWLDTKSFKEEFEKDLIGFLRHVHEQVMNLPAPTPR